MYETSGELLQEQRTRAGWTQTELSRRSGIPKRTISRIENGDKPHSETIRKLSRALGVRYASLLGREFDETQYEVEEIPYDPTDEGGLAGQIWTY